MGGSQDGPICAVYSCKNYAVMKNSRSMFRFSKDKDLCKKWVIASRRLDLDELIRSKGPEHLYKSCRICSDHFEVKCFRNPKLLSQGLVRGSIPTLLLDSPDAPASKRPSPKKRYRPIDMESSSSSQSNLPTDSNDGILPDARRPK